MFIQFYCWLCRLLLSWEPDTYNYLYWKQRMGFIHEDLEPKHCMQCWSSTFIVSKTCSVGGAVCEQEYECLNCRTLCGSWEYGSWLP
jgi:hypothetical protein